MNHLTEEKQQLAVKKVLEEMEHAEEYALKIWNANWWEQYVDAYCLLLYYQICEADVREMERKYGGGYNLANAFYSKDSIGIPLAKKILVGDNTLTGETDINFECEFGRINWCGMTSHKAKRHFSFANNGDIDFSKEVKRRQTLQNPRKISYMSSYNVLSSDFVVKIFIDELKQSQMETHNQHDHLAIALNGNDILMFFNGIEIIQNLNTKIKTIRKYDDCYSNPSIIYEAVLNLDDRLEMDTDVIPMCEVVEQAESQIIEMLKCIKGELPLQGLTERIDNCLKLLEEQHVLVDSNKPKTLELKSMNM